MGMDYLTRREFISATGKIVAFASVAGLAASIGCTTNKEPDEATPYTPARYLALIVLDGCRPDYFDLIDIPHIRQLMSAGTVYTQAWDGILRNDTPAGHAVIPTGAFPKKNGIIGFGWRDPSTGKYYASTEWNNIASGNYNKIIKDTGCSDIGSIYKKTYPDAKVAAFSSGKYYAAAPLGAVSADFIGFCKEDEPSHGTVVGWTMKPFQVSGGLIPKPELINDPELTRRVVNYWDGDTWTIDYALKLFESERPEMLLINLSMTDMYGHKYLGTAESTAKLTEVMTNVAVQIGRIVEAYKNAGIYDQTIFVVTADHGMADNCYLLDEQALSAVTSKYAVTPGGGTLQFNLPDSSRIQEAAEEIARLKLDGINGVYYKEKNENGDYFYMPASASVKMLDPDVIECYRYLADSFASPQSADIVLFMAANWNGKPSFNSFNGGDHGTFTWENQNVPLIIAGPGIKKQNTSAAPARLLDIAPTVVTAMGMLPENMDGIVLADALLSPASELTRIQKDTNTQLNPFKDALKKQFEKDLENNSQFTPITVLYNTYENNQYGFSLQYKSTKAATKDYPTVLFYRTGGDEPPLMINDADGPTLPEALVKHLSEITHPQEPLDYTEMDEVLGDGTPARKITFSYYYKNSSTVISVIGFGVRYDSKWVMVFVPYWGGVFTAANAQTLYDQVKQSFKSSLGKENI